MLVALFCGGIPIAVIMLGVKRGHWIDNHVRVREQRAVPLMATMASVMTGTSLLVVLGAPREVFALVVAMLVGLVITMAVTVWWKVSIRTAVAPGVVIVLFVAYGTLMALLVPGVAAVGWSRVVLHDHTITRTVAGGLLGGVVATSRESVAATADPPGRTSPPRDRTPNPTQRPQLRLQPSPPYQDNDNCRLRTRTTA
ncbi:hypothetical protein [Streptomyces olivaceoviridis]|uniref:hypothetical protein n=1 Tax=Streptomyces olivaceoviridis TaxID=1921 RepID=UPI0037BDFD1F